MNTPLNYYGGKTNMLPHILPKIPEHQIYVEAFAGGAAVFFAKKPSSIEVLNDINGNIANFYRVMATNFKELNVLIETTLHDEYSHKLAQKIFFNQTNETVDDLTRAWAVWVLSHMSFGGDFSNKWQFVKNKTDNWHPAIRVRNKREYFKYLENRLKTTSIHNTDALEVITKRDADDVFQFLDPPYVGARQGHYSGYTQNNYNDLVELLKTVKSKFLLSSYKNKAITKKIAEKYNWTIEEIEQRSAVSGKNHRKIELLIYNYEIPKTNFIQTNIFNH